jgi:uncharacterized repeat protein (TIGR01451 family)
MRRLLAMIAGWVTAVPAEQSVASVDGLAGHTRMPRARVQVIRAGIVFIMVGGAFVLLSSLLAVRLQAAPLLVSSAELDSSPTEIEQIDFNWTKRIKLTFTNTAQTEPLVDFPVLVTLNGSRIDYAHTLTNGEDIRFVDADGVSVLAHEIERWDEDGTSYVWVKVPRIEPSSDNDYIWMYFGNPEAHDGQDPTNVFTDTYRMVYHLEESPALIDGVVRDSTANAFHGLNKGSTDAPGFIANAQDFGGAGQYVDLGSDLPVINGVSAATLSAWIRPDSDGNSGDILAVSRYNYEYSSGNSRASIQQRSANLEVYARSTNDDSDFRSPGTTSYPLSSATWHYAVAVVNYAEDTVSFYVDGLLQTSVGDTDFTNSVTPLTNSANCAMGSNDDGLSSFFAGRIDEARVAATSRSADWIRAQYLSMTDAFIAYGAAEDVGMPAFVLDVWASRDEVFAGSRLEYSLLVHNMGGLARQLVVSDELPAFLTYGGCDCANAGKPPIAGPLSSMTGGCGVSFSCGLEGGNVVWRVDEVDPDRLLQLTFWAAVDSGLSDGTMIVNEDYAMAAELMTPLVINQPVTTTVRELLLTVASQAWPNPVDVGQRLQLTITLRNDGGLLENVTVTDRLPSELSYVGCEGALCELASNQSDVHWWLPSLPGNSEQQLTLQAVVQNPEGDAIIHDSYGAWVPEAGRFVMGPPMSIKVSTLISYPHRVNIPIVFTNVTR